MKYGTRQITFHIYEMPTEITQFHVLHSGT